MKLYANFVHICSFLNVILKFKTFGSLSTHGKKSTVDLLSILSDMIKAEYVSDGVYVKEKL